MQMEFDRKIKKQVKAWRFFFVNKTKIDSKTRATKSEAHFQKVFSF